MTRWAAFLLLLGLAVRASAGTITCKASLYVKVNFVGDAWTFGYTPNGSEDVAPLLDLQQLHPTATVPKWDDKTHSVNVSCTCKSGSCAADFAKVALRLFADPYWRKTQGGAHLDVACAASADKTKCTGALASMPGGWAGRVSAAVILYNSPTYKLPTFRPSDDESTCPRRSGYVVYANTAFTGAAGSKKSVKAADKAMALCSADEACSAWGSDGSYLQGSIASYSDAPAVCTYVKTAARRA